MADPGRLAEAAHRRHLATLGRAREALRRLDAAGEAITFSAVAAAASVSRSWLYAHPTIRVEIERLRAVRPSTPKRRVPAAQRASTESLQRRLDAVRNQISQLREENQMLREQLVVCVSADNERRSQANPIPTPQRLVMDMSSTRKALPHKGFWTDAPDNEQSGCRRPWLERRRGVHSWRAHVPLGYGRA